MLTELILQNFRGFERHKLPFRQTTVIVGRNNAGKSTIVEALRLVSIVTARYQTLAYKQLPDWLELPRRTRVVSPSIEGLEIVARGIFHRYGDPPASIEARFSSGHSVEVYIGPEMEVAGVIKLANGKTIGSKGEANTVIIPQVSILPQIGPLLVEEIQLNADYIRQSMYSTRSSLHFRNQLHLFQEFFKNFKSLSEETWPGLLIKKIEIQNVELARNILLLYVRDGDFEAEIGWMGHGLQMWLQTMWLLSHASNSDAVILDEPDVYMHADLQRRLIRHLKVQPYQKIIASHSVEIMAEVEPDDILVVNKKRRTSEFAGTKPAVQGLLRNLGSIQNIQLARMADARRFLFVEGDDIAILKRFQNTLYPESRYPLDSIPGSSIGGWSGWEKAVGCASLLRDADKDITCYCILDRDYRTKASIERRRKSAETNQVELHIWRKKEVENYLLIPSAICRLILKNAPNNKGPTDIKVAEKLSSIVESYKSDTFNSIANEYYLEDREHGIAGANKKAQRIIDEVWIEQASSHALVCGKQVISDLSGWANDQYKAGFSVLALARELKVSEIDQEIVDALTAIEEAESFKSL